MNKRHHTRRPSIMACALVLLAGLAGCAAQPQAVAAKEDSLAAAGFTPIPANTPDRVAMLSRLPANRFVRRTHGDGVTYVYGDPLVCNCLYVGSQQAYAQYRVTKQRQRIADEQALAARDYADPNWNWGGWGGGSFGPNLVGGTGF